MSEVSVRCRVETVDFCFESNVTAFEIDFEVRYHHRYQLQVHRYALVRAERIVYPSLLDLIRLFDHLLQCAAG